MPTTTSKEREFCEAARDYLMTFDGVTSEVLASYLTAPTRKSRISDVYYQLLWSSQNANMRTTVITGSMDGGMGALSGVLLGFVPADVIDRYGDDADAVLDTIVSEVKPRGRVRRSPRSIWPQFSGSIVSGARFLAPYPDAEAFYAWADVFASDGQALSELPLTISWQVSGVGFALACDFLKEIGCADIGKPDVHIKKILAGLGVVPESANDVEVFDALVDFARSAGLSTYHVDKLMWLVGSGSFYWNPEIGRVDTDRDGFVRTQRGLFG